MSLLTLAQAKAHLNTSATVNDGEMQLFIDSAEAAIAQRCGPLEATTTTVRVDGGGYALVLPVMPVASLTSVTPADSAALTLSDLYLDEAAGLVTYDTGTTYFSARHYDVVFEAGRSSVPDDLMLAVKELVRHLWESQRNPSRFPGSTISEGPVATMGAGYLMPYRVQELIAPYLQAGFA
jgi:hypothetical protein